MNDNYCTKVIIIISVTSVLQGNAQPVCVTAWCQHIWCIRLFSLSISSSPPKNIKNELTKPIERLFNDRNLHIRDTCVDREPFRQFNIQWTYRTTGQTAFVKLHWLFIFFCRENVPLWMHVFLNKSQIFFSVYLTLHLISKDLC